MARILFLMARRLNSVLSGSKEDRGGEDGPEESGVVSSSSSSLEHVLRIAISMSVIFSPTKGSDHVNTSMKFGSQYGWGVQLNWRMFITLFSYLSTAALLL